MMAGQRAREGIRVGDRVRVGVREGVVMDRGRLSGELLVRWSGERGAGDWVQPGDVVSLSPTKAPSVSEPAVGRVGVPVRKKATQRGSPSLSGASKEKPKKSKRKSKAQKWAEIRERNARKHERYERYLDRQLRQVIGPEDGGVT